LTVLIYNDPQMKIIRFIGGLGNQMFQYAFYKTLQKKHSDIRVDLSAYKIDKSHNGYELEHIFNVKLRKVSGIVSDAYDINNRKWLPRKIRKIFGLNRYHKNEHTDFVFDPLILSNSESRYFSGFWQNEMYFKDIASEIKDNFQFLPLTDPQNLEALQQIKQSNSVSIHIRRGDYVDHPSFGGLCDKHYYQQAIELINSKTEDAKFFIFSNDIDWCKATLDIPSAEFISWNTGSNSYIDMQLMSECKHNIIANSSFSWWAAWLNSNPSKIVVGPAKWIHGDYNTSTLLPKSWIRL
jgi:hypothetical protein